MQAWMHAPAYISTNLKRLCYQNTSRLGVGVHACNPGTWEVDTEESGVKGQPQLQSKLVLGQPGLLEILFQEQGWKWLGQYVQA